MAYKAAYIRIFAGTTNQAVGAGFLVTDELGLTCAHVVEAALRSQADATASRVEVDLPLLPGGSSARFTASVHRVYERHDIALLRFSDLPPTATPVRLVDNSDVWGHQIRTFGFPRGHPKGVWHVGILRGQQADLRIQSDLAPGNGYRITRGFSGAPVWDEQLSGVVGMVVQAESENTPAAVLVPTGQLVEVDPSLRPLAVPPSPFRSLQPLGTEDTSLLLGRTAERDSLVARVRAEPAVTLAGPSGCGKSSLALAGAVPILRACGYAVVVLRPAQQPLPLRSLASELLALVETGVPLVGPRTPAASREASWNELEAREQRVARVQSQLEGTEAALCVARTLARTGSRRLLIVIDQFEEALEAPSGLRSLVEVVTRSDLVPYVRLLMTLRADVLAEVLADPVLGPVAGRSVHPLLPMSRSQLHQVAADSVGRVPGIHYESGLEEKILNDASGMPGALALLVHTLDLLWRHQTHGSLTHEAYEHLGGVKGALSRHAEEVWRQNIPPTLQSDAEQLLKLLVRLPLTASEAPTRRTILLGDLKPAQQELAARLATTRLLVTGQDLDGRQDTVELAHEALITGWDRLSQLLRDDRLYLAWNAQVRHDAERWQKTGRTADYLPGPRLLEEAAPWLHQRAGDMENTVKEFLTAGQRRQNAVRRRRRTLVTALTLIVSAALILGTLFVQQSRESARRGAEADSRALVAAASDREAQDPAAAMILAVAAYRTSNTQEARSALLRYYLANRDTRRVLTDPAGEIKSAQSDRDGSVITAVTAGGRATLFTDALGDKPRTTTLTGPAGAVTPLASADGNRVGYLTAHTAVWFDVHGDGTVGPAATLPLGRGVDLGEDPDELGGASAAFSPDGRRLAVVQDGGLVWWDLAAPLTPHRITVRQEGEGTAQVWAGANEDTFVTSSIHGSLNNQRIAAVDVATSQIRTLATGVGEADVSGDGRYVVICQRDGKQVRYQRLRVANGSGQTYQFSDTNSADDGYCQRITADTVGDRFTLDATLDLLVTLGAGTDASADAYSYARTGTPVQLVSSPSGTALLTYEGNALYARDAGATLLNPAQAELTPDGHMVTVDKDRAEIELRRPDGDHGVLRTAPLSKPAWEGDLGLTVSPDGKTLALQESANRIVVRDAATLRPVGVVNLPGVAATSNGQGPSVQFYYDGSGQIVTLTGTEVARWEARTGVLLDRLDLSSFLSKDATEDMGIEPGLRGGTVAVVAPHDPSLLVVDLGNGHIVQRLHIGTGATGASFDTSGRYLVVLRTGGGLELWTTNPLTRRVGPLPSFDKDVSWIGGFIDDGGHYLLAAQNHLRLYDISKGTFTSSDDLGSYDPSTTLRSDNPYGFLSSSKGKLLYAQEFGPNAIMLHTLQPDPKVWAAALCAVTGDRRLSNSEQIGLPAHMPTGDPCG
ncbi:nSTAND1 domain-containing NTPase [Streptomyces sp. CA2R106]|uniref:nSTAND1 domain-containing NTPase n=1 Tax=Streptomyces sp. CA2R106 TaxID=3120153 RepID=UPI00300BB6F0